MLASAHASPWATGASKFVNTNPRSCPAQAGAAVATPAPEASTAATAAAAPSERQRPLRSPARTAASRTPATSSAPNGTSAMT